ncbi:MAG TPA: hypothetical protein VHR45_20900, partial [Thermoanaerobaculia bacterium]|nr:hypothetical protein [Thermoanaerobaculia bacterium]
EGERSQIAKLRRVKGCPPAAGTGGTAGTGGAAGAGGGAGRAGGAGEDAPLRQPAGGAAKEV